MISSTFHSLTPRQPYVNYLDKRLRMVKNGESYFTTSIRHCFSYVSVSIRQVVITK